MFKRILIGIDQRAATGHAVQVGAALASALGAEVALAHVVDPSLGAPPEAGIPATELLSDLEQTGAAYLRSVREHLPADLVTDEFLREGDPSGEILAVASAWGADLIVVGVQHHSGLAQKLLPSATETIVREARCAVLTVPAEASE